jgi:hypothetical protein
VEAVNAHGFLCEAVVVSDDAGQFNVGQHALCWIRAERLVHKLETFTDQLRRNSQRHRSRLPSRITRARQDLREARHRLMGSWRQARRLRQSFRPAACRPHPVPRTACLMRQGPGLMPRLLVRPATY